MEEIEWEFKVGNDKIYVNGLEVDVGGCYPKFTEREIFILKNRLGQKKMTLLAIGELYGVSKERIRQQYLNAIRKLKKRYTAWYMLNRR